MARIGNVEVPWRSPDSDPPPCLPERQDRRLCARHRWRALVEVYHERRRLLVHWYKIGGQLLAGTGPAAYAWGDARIGVFVTGTNKASFTRGATRTARGLAGILGGC